MGNLRKEAQIMVENCSCTDFKRSDTGEGTVKRSDEEQVPEKNAMGKLLEKNKSGNSSK